MRRLVVGLVSVWLVGCQSAPEYVAEAPWSCRARMELSSLWGYLRDKYDADRDNRVTADDEYTRGETRFVNYDRDGNGVLEPADFPEDTFINGFNHMILRYADANEDEEITRSEWDAFASTLDADGNDWIVAEEVKEVVGPWAASDWRLFLLSFDQDADGAFRANDLEITFRDQDFDGNGVLAGKETAGWASTMERPDHEPPAGGEAAPDFELPYADDATRSFRLADGVRERPVALVLGATRDRRFGSQPVG